MPFSRLHCKPCITFFHNMPALFIMNQRVKVGLHVLHEIWNFFYLFFSNYLCRIHFRNQIDTETYRESYDGRNT